MKLDAISEEAKLLARHRIDTGEQLSSYKEALETKLQTRTADRKALYKKRRTVTVKSDEERTSQVKAEIAALSKELATIRREVKLCDDIAIRSGVMKEKIKTVREDERKKGKEQSKDEQFRRRSGTDRQA